MRDHFKTQKSTSLTLIGLEKAQSQDFNRVGEVQEIGKLLTLFDSCQYGLFYIKIRLDYLILMLS